ncbi:MAG TPA: HPF/RaiA family ribosome-associated protein [Planctomycetota bacterium]|nr:HPF/RaiA family ribosome-associated protein [Planctomycetota bacterium]
MVIPLKVVDRDRLLPADLMQRLRKRTQKLAHFFDGVEECRLSVDGPGQHPLAERVRVRLYLSVSGTEVAVSHQSGEDLSIALRSAFDAADRRLKAHARLARTGGSKAGRGPKRRAE